jgi:decaprenylphospho-beta-D-erythro-pentofuranosid-2-ulose 2-reductase
MTQTILIVGATSGIAQALARRFAQRGARMFLVARDSSRVEAVAADLRARGASAVNVFVMDVNDTARLDSMLQNAWQTLGHVDFALVAHGTLPDSARASTDRTYLIEQFRTNAESVIVCLAGLAQCFQSQGNGVLGVIGSVAGDRGRASNYAYGAAKAAVHAFASGLRAQLFRHGVHVVTIKPGFVATQMTAHLNLPARLTAQPDTVAARIESALESRANIVYTPGFWWMVMAIIRLMPEALFKRLRL